MDEARWQRAAGVVWPLLVATAERRGTLTYGDFAPHIHTNAQSVKYPLNLIRDFLLANGLPELTWIAVNQETGEPGEGSGVTSEDDVPAAQGRVYAFDWESTSSPFPNLDTEEGVLPPRERISAPTNRGRGVRVPTAAEFDATVEKFDAAWGGVDEILYRVCRDHPDHGSRRSIMTKSILIGRSYAAGIERSVKAPRGGQSVDRIGECLERHGAEVDEIIAALDADAERLTLPRLQSIVEQHGRLTALLAEHLTRGRSNRSFVSKYLHFHRPIVPIYDEYCDTNLTRRVRWAASVQPFEPLEGADEHYYRFCIRLWRLYEGCLANGMDPTVKDFDAFLWQVPD